MTRTGRPPKPVEVHRRNGNPSRRHLPEPVVVLPPAPVGGPIPPEGLGDTGRRFWVDAWQAGSAWLSPAIDFGTVELAARTFDEIVGHRQEIAARGAVIESPIMYKGEAVPEVYELKPNPAMKMLRDAEKSLLAILIELGFTPSARARLGLVQVKAQSKLEQLARAREERSAAR